MDKTPRRSPTGDDWSVGKEGKVDTWVRHQVGLDLSQVYVDGAVEAQRGGDGRHGLGDQTVEVDVGGALDVQVAVT